MSNSLLPVAEASRIYHNRARERIEVYLRRFGVMMSLRNCIESGGTEFFFDLPITKRFSAIWQGTTVDRLIDHFAPWRNVSEEMRESILKSVEEHLPHMRDIERVLVYLGYKVNRRLIDDRHHYCPFDDIACFMRFRVSGWIESGDQSDD
jgi:hypothetical protein